MIHKNVGIICYWETGLAFKTNFFIQQIWSNPTGGLIILNIFLPLSVVKILLSIRVSDDCLNNYCYH